MKNTNTTLFLAFGVFLVLASVVSTVKAQTGPQAQTIVLLSINGDDDFAGQRPEVRNQTLMILRAFDYIAVDMKNHPCDSSGCADEMLTEINQPNALALVIALWPHSSAGPGEPVEEGIGNATVILIDAQAQMYPVTVSVQQRNLPVAIEKGILSALELYRHGPGPWLRTSGGVGGSEVRIDGQYAGTLPYLGAIRPGEHIVTVSSVSVAESGNAAEAAEAGDPAPTTQHYPVSVPLSRDNEINLDLSTTEPLDPSQIDPDLIDPTAIVTPPIPLPTLTPTSPAASATTEPTTTEPTFTEPTTTEPTPPQSNALHVAGPIVLGVAGFGLALVPVMGVIQNECRVGDDSGCLIERQINTRAAIGYSAGAAALLGASVAWGVLGNKASRSANTTLNIHPTGVRLSHRF